MTDAHGKKLTDYPRPSVAVDTAVLTVDGGELRVLLDVSAGLRRLPGAFLREGELLADAVRRSLAQKVSVTGVEPAQLRVFDALDRDDRGRVLAVAHLAVVPIDRLAEASGTLAPVEGLTGLHFDHDEIVRIAADRLRIRYRERPDPDHLLGASFTLPALQSTHEAVLGERLPRDTFRRRMTLQLRETGVRVTGSVGKPPRTFARGDAP